MRTVSLYRMAEDFTNHNDSSMHNGKSWYFYFFHVMLWKDKGSANLKDTCIQTVIIQVQRLDIFSISNAHNNMKFSTKPYLYKGLSFNLIT